MHIKRITSVGLAVVMLAATFGTALAKDLGRVVISGPGLKSPIEITDHDLANQFGLALLDNLDAQKADAPASPAADFYTIDRGYRDDTGTIVGYDHVRYYPDVKGGQGLFQFMGTDGYESKYEGAWFHASAAGEKAIVSLLAEHGVVLAAAAPLKVDTSGAEDAVEPDPARSEPVQAEAPGTTPPAQAMPSNLSLIVIGALVVVIAAGAGLTLARSKARQV